MGNGQRGAALNQVVERDLNFALRFRVDRRGGFVENQNARIDQQRPGDRNPLPFAAGKRLATLADKRIVTVGKVQNKIVGAGGTGGGDDFRSRCIRPAVGDVLGNRAVKQKRVLQHDADVLAILGDGVRTNVDAVDENGPVGDIEKSADQID